MLVMLLYGARPALLLLVAACPVGALRCLPRRCCLLRAGPVAVLLDSAASRAALKGQQLGVSSCLG
eukprot:9541372-Alexandrium_andersonii.AAC.1